MCFFLISFSLSHNIERYYCSSNIDGYLYNFSATEYLEPYQIDDNYGYFVRGKLCGNLAPEDFPDGFNYVYGVSALRCLINNSSQCDIIGFTDTQDFDFINPNSPDDGVVIKQIAQNNNVEQGFYIYQISYPLSCSESSELIPSSTYMFDLDSIRTIAIEFSNIYGCPQKDVLPTPTPEPIINVNCSAVDYSEILYPYKISADFSSTVATKPYGIPISINSSSFALVNLCNVGNCPPSKLCDEINSSIWYCTSDNKCKSYGNANEGVKLSIKNEDHADEGFILDYNIGKVTITCNFDVFSGNNNSSLVQIDKVEFDNNNHANIAASSIDVCMKPVLPTPHPSCSTSIGGKSIDLTVLNKLGGYMGEIDIIQFPNTEYTLYVQPCGGLSCPTIDCDGANGASIWLCRNDNSRISCDSYGSFYEDILVTQVNENDLFNNDFLHNMLNTKYKNESLLTEKRKNTYKVTNDLTEGIYVYYNSLISGNMALTSRLQIRCDWQMDIFDMRIDDIGSLLNYSQLQISGASNQMCTGEKPWFPPIPSPTVMPTPEIHPTTIFERNTSSEFVSFKLISMFDGAPTVYHSMILNEIESDTHKTSNDTNGNKTNITFQYTPFNTQKCPDGNVCEIVTETDGWGCWYEHCYPIATHNYSFSIIETDTMDISAYSIKGYDYLSLDIYIKCNQSASSINLDNIIEYQNGKLIVNANANFVCPQDIPTQEPTLTTLPTGTIEPEPSFKKTTGGAIFNIAIAAIFILYLAFGTLYQQCRYGVFKIPNEEFWNEFKICIFTAIRYIFCCMKSNSLNQNSEYDTYTSNNTLNNVLM